ncbi:hypothetical protein [Vibrio paucivorans]
MKKSVALGLLLPCIATGALAKTVIHMENASSTPIIPAFQSQIMVDLGVDSIGGWIKENRSHSYDTDNEFFNSTSVGIREGQTITKIAFLVGEEFVECGTDVVFTGEKRFVYDEGSCKEVPVESVIVIKNTSTTPIYGAFQSQIMQDYAADSQGGWISEDRSHSYNTDNEFFNDPTINIKDGDTIPKVGVYVQGDDFVDCAEDVVFEGLQIFAYDGETCVQE